MSINKGMAHPEFQIIHLSLPARYALEGMAEIAQRPGGEFFLAEDVARRRRLPANFVSKIFQRLVERGLLRSRRGPGGGYALARPARSVRLEEIVQAAGESLSGRTRSCLLGLRHCGKDNPCPAHETVARAEREIGEALGRLTLEDLRAADRTFIRSRGEAK